VDYVAEGAWTQKAHRAGGFFEHAATPDAGAERVRVEPGDMGGDQWESSFALRRRGTLSFPVEVEVTMADGSTRREHWDGEGEFVRFAWTSGVALRGVVVDPDDRVMVDPNRENNHASVEGSTHGAWRSLERATYLMQLAVQAVSP
jgi:hypothetical protein